MKYRIVLAILLVIQISSTAQYAAYEPKKEWIKSGSALVLFGGSQLIKFNVQPLSIDEINSLSIDQINKFDRQATSLWSPKHARASDILMMSSYAFPLTMVGFADARKQWKTVGHLYFQTAVVTVALTETIKALVQRTRPYVYNEEVSLHHKTDRDARFSFVSGHTSTVAANCFLTASMFSTYSDDRLSQALVWTGAAIYPLLVGYLRVRAGKHFITDIIGGYVLGASIGLTMPWLLEKLSSKSN